MKSQHFLLFLPFLLFAQTNTQEAQTYVCIRTNMGSMRVKIHGDTPLHRENFLKLVNNKHFNGTLFYRSVKNFVIQGGSSDSRNAPQGKQEK